MKRDSVYSTDGTISDDAVLKLIHEASCAYKDRSLSVFTRGAAAATIDALSELLRRRQAERKGRKENSP